MTNFSDIRLEMQQRIFLRKALVEMKLLKEHYEKTEKDCESVLREFQEHGYSLKYTRELAFLTHKLKILSDSEAQLLRKKIAEKNQYCAQDLKLMEEIIAYKEDPTHSYLKDKIIEAVKRGFRPTEIGFQAGFDIKRPLVSSAKESLSSSAIEASFLTYFFPDQAKELITNYITEG